MEEIHRDKVAWLTLEKSRLKSLKCRLTAQRARCQGEEEKEEEEEEEEEEKEEEEEAEEDVGKDAVSSGLISPSKSISHLRGNLSSYLVI